MVGTVLHETLGHPIELDRVLGDESDNFGSSFLKRQHMGRFTYASPIVNVVADGTLPGGVGSYGFDHEGVPAQRVQIVKDGVFQGFLSSRESGYSIGGQSNGSARASSWNRIPMVRITNLVLEPGESSLERMIAETRSGIYVETWKATDIDDKRLSFSFMGERGWRIRDGKLAELVKHPVIYGETPTFWSTCTGIGSASESFLTGILGCGKGLPWQFVATGQGGPPARFEGVRVGGGLR
jgi:TldD protein